MTSELEEAVRAVNIFYDLAVKVQEASEYNILGSHYAVGAEAMENLSDFLADFHDDNPGLWNLLLKDERGVEKRLLDLIADYRDQASPVLAMPSGYHVDDVVAARQLDARADRLQEVLDGP